MKKLLRLSNLLAIVFFLAYILSAYAFEGNHLSDLIFLIMMAISNIFRQMIDGRIGDIKTKRAGS